MSVYVLSSLNWSLCAVSVDWNCVNDPVRTAVGRIAISEKLRRPSKEMHL